MLMKNMPHVGKAIEPNSPMDAMVKAAGAM